MRTLTIGQRASTTRVFRQEDVAEYRRLTGAGQTCADTVPGGLLGGMFSQLLGTELPGPGTNWLKQKLRFPAPARAGQPITATVEIVRLRPDKQLVNLRTTCVDAHDGTLVCDGEALVMAREMLALA